MIFKLYVKVALTVFFCHCRLGNVLLRKHMSTSKVEDLTSYLLLDNGKPFDCSIKALYSTGQCSQLIKIHNFLNLW